MRRLILWVVTLMSLTLAAKQKVSSPDYYKIMGVKKDATDDQIKKAFKKQAIKYHPDKNPDDPEGSKQKF